MPSLPTWPTQVTLMENVGSLDAPRTAHLFTFGPKGRVMNSEGRDWSKKISKK